VRWRSANSTVRNHARHRQQCQEIPQGINAFVGPDGAEHTPAARRSSRVAAMAQTEMAIEAMAAPKRTTAQTSRTSAIATSGRRAAASLSTNLQLSQVNSARHQAAASTPLPRSVRKMGGVATSSGTNNTTPADTVPPTIATAPTEMLRLPPEWPRRRP